MKGGPVNADYSRILSHALVVPPMKQALAYGKAGLGFAAQKTNKTNLRIAGWRTGSHLLLLDELPEYRNRLLKGYTGPLGFDVVYGPAASRSVG